MFYGVRGFWNPETKCFYSRKGNRIRIPQEVIDAMPNNIFLDGELWYNVIPLLRSQLATLSPPSLSLSPLTK